MIGTMKDRWPSRVHGSPKVYVLPAAISPRNLRKHSLANCAVTVILISDIQIGYLIYNTNVHLAGNRHQWHVGREPTRMESERSESWVKSARTFGVRKRWVESF